MNDSANNPELEEHFFLTNGAKLQRMFPWLRMFRAFRIAIGMKCLLLGLAGVLLLPLGDYLVQSYNGGVIQNYDVTRSVSNLAQTPMTRLMAENFRSPHENVITAAAFEFGYLSSPSGDVLAQVFRMSSQTSPDQWGIAALSVLWSLFVFGILGGAIARIVAHEITGTGGVSLFGSLKFTIRRTHSYLSAPLLTLVGMGMCWLPLVFAGLVARIPVIGEWLVAIIWVFLLLMGLVLALILIGVILGWPLMFTTISVEASDAFDGLSRAFSYLFNRPWYALFLVLIMSVYGSILSHFVVYVQQFAIGLADQAVTTGLGGRGLSEAPLQLINQWMWIVRHIPLAFGFSFFWVSITIVYFLLRHAEDGTPFFVMGKDKFVATDLPLSGIPAAELREMKIHKESDNSEEATDA